MYALHPLIARTPEELFANAWRHLGAWTRSTCCA